MVQEEVFEKLLYTTLRMKENKMRNPERIDEILKLISEIWHKNPDLRLLQLLLNVCLSNMDFYYTEDNLLEQWLHDHYDNI